MVNRSNYLWAKEYLAFLSEVRQVKESSLGRYWSHLKHLLLWADETPLSQAADVRPSFPAYLAGLEGGLAASTLKKTVQVTRSFFRWAKLSYPQEFRQVPVHWVDGLRPPRADEGPPLEHEFVTLDEVLRLVAVEIPEGDLALRRDRAAAAMLYLSGMRPGALATLPLKAVDLVNRRVKQWPSLGVRTKFDRHATTYLLDIPELLSVVEAWDRFIRTRLPESGMWYTPTINRWGEHLLSEEPPGENRATALVKRMRKLFALAGLPYKSPHRFRHGHAVYGLLRAKTMADYKAVSMNLMHESIRVTDSIYAPLTGNEVQRRIAQLGYQNGNRSPDGGELVELLSSLPDAEISQAILILAERLAG